MYITIVKDREKMVKYLEKLKIVTCINKIETVTITAVAFPTQVLRGNIGLEFAVINHTLRIYELQTI